MKVARTVPPAAAPLSWRDLWHGLRGACSPGRALRAREREIRETFDVSAVFLVSSGTAALTLALIALKSLSPRDEVIIPAYTCFSVPAAVLRAGLRPRLCDVSPTSFDFDHLMLQQTLGPNTLCVVAHHLFGVPSDIKRTRALCHAQGTFVVEDAAQAMGVDVDGSTLGTLGDAGIFSLGRGKNITCGSGGIVITRSPAIADALHRHYREIRRPPWWEGVADFVKAGLLTIFVRPRLFWIPAALPFLHLGETVFPRSISVKRLSGLKAGLLHDWRSRLNRSNQIRSQTAAYFIRRLRLQIAQGASHPYLRLPVLAATPNEKQKLFSMSNDRGLGVSAAYPTSIDEIPEIRSLLNGQRFPFARQVAANLFTIPTHHWLSAKDKQDIATLCASSGQS
jgi:dTDP-4-amino-4,6-dideoxygalactose transaminase